MNEIIPYYDADPPSHLPRDWEGNTAAHLAARGGQLECLQVGACISLCDWEGNTTAHLAARGGQLECLQVGGMHKT